MASIPKSAIPRGVRENRKHKRYNVVGLVDLQAKMDKNRTSEQLITISSGGCSFYAVKDDHSLALPMPLKCSFFWKELIPDWLEIRAELRSVLPLKMDDKTISHYGIEFLEADRILIKPIIDELEKLYLQNKLTLAP